MALTLTENLIRNRVNLTHENLEDIKSLSLPGTFHEKIVSIGTSLRKFSRLKSIDFSRNALESLQGLEHLQLLENLNLYYNNVSTLDELRRLKHNQNLKEIDLRLNPVTRNEPDYRLYLIHMLPNLQKLDDRGVRDRERQAALTHFSTSQASEMVTEPVKQMTVTKLLPRSEMMVKLMKGPSVLVDDDVIDVMNRNEGDFRKPRPLTGSANKDDIVEDYSLEGLKTLDPPKPNRFKDRAMGDVELEKVANHETENVDPRLIRYKELYPNILASSSDNVHRIIEGQRKDPNLMFTDQEEANGKFRSQGYFTPHPASERKSRVDGISQDDNIRKNRPRHIRTQSLPAAERLVDADQAKEKNLLFSMLNLVDRYWNGTKSLHKNPKFIEQALKFISEYTMTQGNINDKMSALKQTMESLKEENKVLKRQKEIGQTESEAELKISLRKAKEDMERLHDEVRHYVTENRDLQKRLQAYESTVDPSHYNSAAAASDSGSISQTMIDNLQRQNSLLSNEIEMMKSKLKQYYQLQDLASMLQESHKSLIETNNHLLCELHDEKQKHQLEIEQMHWSYEQLKTNLSHNSFIIQPSPRNDHGNNYATSGKSNQNKEKESSVIL
ncbi:centrosomal protein of 72 kDa-like isoform X2 [Physella acuta]|uniref:centrosomal protein of 72 kDa-like isoform X2 n=1 Tax=Physella acuta TaxID=109671 RepID=UPI0027DC35FD|nr:centrosomal protein of 72 kDa-like isoform X2 [Physella acuta]